MINPLYSEEARKIMKRNIKHPAMIRTHSKPYYNCTTHIPSKFIGIDFETDSNTGEIILFGVYFNNVYFSYHKDVVDLLEYFCRWIKKAIDEEYTLIHWTKFDQNAISKLFLSKLNKEERIIALNKYGKSAATYGKDGWNNEPLCSIYYTIKKTLFEFGISFVLDKKMLNVYMFNEKMAKPLFLNIIDMNTLYKTTLEKACTNNNLTYYTKMNEGYVKKGITYSFHVVDWELYKIDLKYKEGVLKSNELDCRAVRDLGILFIEKFYRVFKVYPKTIYSSGTLAKMALSVLLNEEDFESLNLIRQFNNWGYNNSKETKLLCDKLHILACECYSGGLFELYALGKGDVYIADISACYPAAINKLLDLRDSTIIEGVGEPPKPKSNEYIFIRGKVNVPKECIHTFRIFNPDKSNTITRPYGEYYTAYIWQEREFARQQGTTFSEEEYIIIKTKGLKSPLAIASQKLFDMRQELIKQKDDAQSIAKTANNSCYGITIEGVPTYSENDKKEYIFDGFKAGSMYNPILATLITAYGRLTLCTAMKLIKDNGGKLIQANTDSIHWKGKKSDLPKNFKTIIGECGWREDKQIGYFEEPTLIKEFISLATGRYGGYNTQKKSYFSKLRSYSINYNPNKHYLKELLEERQHLEECKSIPLFNNTFVSIKLSKARLELDLDDVCRIDKDEKDMMLISLDGKRLSNLSTEKNPIPKLLKKFYSTEPYYAQCFIKDQYEGIKKLKELVINKSKGIKTKQEVRKETYKKINQNPERKVKEKERKRYLRENMTEEQKMIIRFKDRERKKYNKKEGLKNENV